MKTPRPLDIQAAIDLLNILMDKENTKHLIAGPFNPLDAQTNDNEACLWPVTPVDLTVSRITVTLDAAGNEVLGDLKYADAFIGLANAVVINDFDTTSGVRVDSSITVGAVPAGKCIYLSFDSAPDAAIKTMCVDIEFSWD